jgi:hypothetical protein
MMTAKCHDAKEISSNNNNSKVSNRLDAFLSEKLSAATNQYQDVEDYASLPVYTLADVSIRNGQSADGGGEDLTHAGNSNATEPIWISYGGLVYDITEFVISQAHPGGSARLIRAAGKPLEPYWAWHVQHFETDIPLTILQSYCPVVGRLADDDQQQVDDEVEQLQTDILPQIIKIEWRCRHGEDMDHDIHSSSSNDGGSYHVQEVTVAKLQEEYPQTDQVSQVGCPKNISGRRPVSTSVVSGVTIKDLVSRNSNIVNAERDSSGIIKIVDVTFYARDGEKVSISHHTSNGVGEQTDNACDAAKSTRQSFDDVLLCYEMDGVPITRARGFPIRAIIPGKRVVKWVERIVISYDLSR